MLKVRSLLSEGRPKLPFLVALLLANASYATHGLLGSIVTVTFFSVVPGYLLFRLLNHEVKSRWIVMLFSLTLSILILMVGGLALNSLHVLGLSRPLTTLRIFAVLDLASLVLLVLSKSSQLRFSNLRPRYSSEQVIAAATLSLLPLLSAGGAIRLNNYASNTLTMISFGAGAVMFLFLIARRQLSPLYPYAVLTLGLSVLLAISLRDRFVVANDIQHEFRLFQLANNNAYWNIRFPKGDPYNACLSITILPTILAKVSSIPPVYIFKVIFQIFFAFGVVPIYFLVKRFHDSRLALTAALIFISFPPFVNGMSFITRQEIAFLFFSLLILVTFLDMPRRSKTLLTVLCLSGVTLSHYASGYVAIGILALAWVSFKFLRRTVHRRTVWQPYVLPALSAPIIIVALLFTFLWNMQVTSSSLNLTSTITQTFKGILGGNAPSQANGVNYALISPQTLSPAKVLSNHAGNNVDQVHYTPPQLLPTTYIGKLVSHVISNSSLNSVIRGFSAKILQLLLLLGCVLLFLRQKKKAAAEEAYVLALTLACIVLLVMITFLPQLSVGYGVTRLFQQTLIITVLPIIMAAEFLAGFLKQYKIYIVAVFFAFLFLDLSGFIPQALGGYPPQLSLNNWGTDFDTYYIHKGDTMGAHWLSLHDTGQSVAADFYAHGRINGSSIKGNVVHVLDAGANSTFLYQDYPNVRFSRYATFLNGDVIEYSFAGALQNRNLVYSNQSSRTYELTNTTQGAK